MTTATAASGERRVALVTGASGGIGKAFAELLAREGYALVLVARSEADLSRVAGLITATHDLPVAAVAVDLAAPGAVDEIFAALDARGIRPEIVVNNAGSGLMGHAAELDTARQLAIIDLNCRALTELSLRCLPEMRHADTGGIINISSTAAYMPGPNMAVYYATKAYVLSFGEALAGELDGSGVTVTTVCPGATRTGFQTAAGMTGARLLRMPMMSAEKVAERGYAGFRAGRRVVVPGAINKIVAWTAPLTPRAIQLPLVRFFHGGGRKEGAWDGSTAKRS